MPTHNHYIHSISILIACKVYTVQLSLDHLLSYPCTGSLPVWCLGRCYSSSLCCSLQLAVMGLCLSFGSQTFLEVYITSKLIKLWDGTGSIFDSRCSCSSCSGSACPTGKCHFSSIYSSFYFSQFISIISSTPL
jgi:hypothetical protein